jgi:hypothetical protein
LDKTCVLATRPCHEQELVFFLKNTRFVKGVSPLSISLLLPDEIRPDRTNKANEEEDDEEKIHFLVALHRKLICVG